MTAPSLFDAAAELIALAEGKPLSQVRIELGPAPRVRPCTACNVAPCACPSMLDSGPHDSLTCAKHGAPMRLRGVQLVCKECR